MAFGRPRKYLQLRIPETETGRYIQALESANREFCRRGVTSSLSSMTCAAITAITTLHILSICSVMRGGAIGLRSLCGGSVSRKESM